MALRDTGRPAVALLGVPVTPRQHAHRKPAQERCRGSLLVTGGGSCQALQQVTGLWTCQAETRYRRIKNVCR